MHGRACKFLNQTLSHAPWSARANSCASLLPLTPVHLGTSSTTQPWVSTTHAPQQQLLCGSDGCAQFHATFVQATHDLPRTAAGAAPLVGTQACAAAAAAAATGRRARACDSCQAGWPQGKLASARACA
eukprot:453059-Pelagomonas_calceolata.AAC.3